MTKPLLVIVSGPPGAGKTTLAKCLGAELALPVFDRDDLKDIMFDSLGWSDRAWSQLIGATAYELLYLIAERLISRGVSVIVDTNFQRESIADRIENIARAHDVTIVEVNCRAEPDVLARRFRERWEAGNRHEGHTSAFTNEAVFIKELEERDYRASGIGRVVEVDTTDVEQVDLDDIVAKIKGEIDGS